MDIQVIDREWRELETSLDLARKNRVRVLLCRHTNGSYGNFLTGMPDNPDWHLVGVATPPPGEKVPHGIGYFTFANNPDTEVSL